MPTATKHAYARDEARRLVGISERQLRAWEKRNFIAALDTFTIPDIGVLRTLNELRRKKVRPAHLRLALDSVRQRFGTLGDPLAELRVFVLYGRVVVQIAGQYMDAISGQFLLTFSADEIKTVRVFPHAGGPGNPPGERERRREAEQWFEKGLELESTGAPMENILEAYRRAVEIDPTSIGALVNLGTVYFNGRLWREAELYYHRAIEVDGAYALAHFNLGNLYDERGDRPKALEHYQAALEIHPSYADAHYNIALLYQSINQPLKAVQHWKAYLKLDASSEWSAIARRELEKLRATTILHGARPKRVTDAPSRFSPASG